MVEKGEGMNFLAKLLASIIERAWGNKLTTVAGAAAAISAAVAPFVPGQYQKPAADLAAFLAVLAGALGYDKQAAQPKE